MIAPFSFLHKLRQSLRRSDFWLQLTHLANLPVVLIWLYFAVRARHLFFFTTVNPVIETGGVFGESKINILRRLPKQLLPKTLFLKAGVPVLTVQRRLREQQLEFPLIAKPDVGERGTLVAKLENTAALEAYVRRANFDFLIEHGMRNRVLLAFLVRPQHRLASLLIQQYSAAVTLPKVVGRQLTAIDERERQTIHQRRTQFLHQVEPQRGPAGPVGVEKAHLRIEPHAFGRRLVELRRVPRREQRRHLDEADPGRRADFFDPETGLPNRVQMELVARRWIAAARRSSAQ